MLGKVRLEKNSAECLVRSGEVPCPRQTSMDKTTTASSTLNGACSLGAPTHPRVTVFTQWSVVCGGRWPGLRMIKVQHTAGVQTTDNKYSRSLSDGEKYFFPMLERRA